MRLSLLFVTAIALAGACGEGRAPEPAPGDSISAEPEPLDPDAPAAEQAALAPCGAVTAQGYCGVDFGMTPDQVRAAFPVGLDTYSGGDPDAQSDPTRCFEMFAVPPVQGISFLAEMNRVGRIDVLSEGAKTADGVGVGTGAGAIRERFGASLVEQPNKYEPEITELIVSDGDAKFVFEIQDGVVRAWRAGVPPTIDYVEHCG